MINLSTAFSIGSSILGFFDAQQKAAEEEARYQQNRINAAQARDLQIQLLNKRAIQEAERTAGMRFDNAIAALEVSERKAVAAGEAGIGGQGLEQTLAMTEARRLRNNTLYNSQLKGLLDQLEYEKMGIDAQTLNRINSLPRGTPPSFLQAGVGAISSGYSTELKVAGDKPGSFLHEIGLGRAFDKAKVTPFPAVSSWT